MSSPHDTPRASQGFARVHTPRPTTPSLDTELLAELPPPPPSGRPGVLAKPRRPRLGTRDLELAGTGFAPPTAGGFNRQVNTDAMLDALTDSLRDQLDAHSSFSARPQSDGKVSRLTMRIAELERAVDARQQAQMQSIHDLVALLLESLGGQLRALLEHAETIRSLPLTAPEVQTFLRELERLNLDGVLQPAAIDAVSRAVRTFSEHVEAVRLSGG